MINVLILGSNGMLGYAVKKVLSKSKKIDIKTTSRRNNDSDYYFDNERNFFDLEFLFKKPCRIDYIINCIGVLGNQIDTQNLLSIQNAIKINSLFPYDLASLAMKYNSKVIHISTDAVFSESSKNCFEDTSCDPDDIYGKSKRLGEVKSSNFLNIRCSIIGPSPYKKKGILEWFLNQPKNARINGFTNQNWNGVTTTQFAELCKSLIINDYFDRIINQNSTQHFCPNSTVTKYELLVLFQKYFRSDMIVIPVAKPRNKITRTLKTRYTFLNGLIRNDNITKAIKDLNQEINY